MAMAIVLALGSSLVWGCADFMGGFFTRREPLAGVVLVSQGAGFVALLVWLVGSDLAFDERAFVLGLLGGAGGGLGLMLFYRALALGTMSIVSPVVACGALVPFGISLGTGDRPAAVVLAGAVIALCGAVLASADEHRAVESARRQAMLLALGAAVALGLFTEFLGLASRHGDVLPALVGARIGSLAVLGTWALATRAAVRVGRASLPAIVGLGLLDTLANGLFAFATGHGFLSIVSVLGSLYPIATVIAAYALLGERISRPQRAGVLLALVGIALVAAG
jgi:drug/metabolite transporter (DMT)-like permease